MQSKIPKISYELSKIEEIGAESNLERAFDLLFEEVMKSRQQIIKTVRKPININQ